MVVYIAMDISVLGPVGTIDRLQGDQIVGGHPVCTKCCTAQVPMWYLKDGAADALTPGWYPRDESVDAQTLVERHQRGESVLSCITTKQPHFNPNRLVVSQEVVKGTRQAHSDYLKPCSVHSNYYQ